MNLKKYKKFREKIAQKPVDWLEGTVRIQNFCSNHRIEYLFQLIDADIIQEIRCSFKNYRLIVAVLKEKSGVDFEFINGNENDTYRIIPKFISEIKQKAEAGDGNAMFEFSEYLREYHNLQHAHEWHTKAAKAGNPRAMEEEGNFIIYGWVEGSLEDAFNYYQKAAEKGLKEAFSNLGDCFLYGWGCVQNFQKARECYRMASW